MGSVWVVLSMAQTVEKITHLKLRKNSNKQSSLKLFSLLQEIK